MRDIKKIYNSCKRAEIFIHLGCISNDTSFELNSKLSKSINMDAFESMVIASKKQKLKDLSMLPLVQYTEYQKKKCN